MNTSKDEEMGKRARQASSCNMMADTRNDPTRITYCASEAPKPMKVLTRASQQRTLETIGHSQGGYYLQLLQLAYLGADRVGRRGVAIF